MRQALRSSPLVALLAAAACASTAGPAAAPAATAPSAATATPSGATVGIPVAGMTCGGCAGRVRRALEAVEGVLEAEVLLAEKRAVVSYDPARVAPEALVAAIRATGYEPGAPAPITR